MDPIARCTYCQQPLGSEISTVHTASANLHYLCAMLQQHEQQFRPASTGMRVPVGAA
jgi:hypothetical protein